MYIYTTTYCYVISCFHIVIVWMCNSKILYKNIIFCDSFALHSRIHAFLSYTVVCLTAVTFVNMTFFAINICTDHLHTGLIYLSILIFILPLSFLSLNVCTSSFNSSSSFFSVFKLYNNIHPELHWTCVSIWKIKHLNLWLLNVYILYIYMFLIWSFFL